MLIFRHQTTSRLTGCALHACISLSLGLILSVTCTAQVVQLPSTRTFSYSGSAWVPDGGTALLGGNRSARSGQISRGFGPIQSRAIGSRIGGSTASVSVQIIDLKAMDDAILSSNIDPKSLTPTGRTAGSLTANGARNYVGAISRLGLRKPSESPVSNAWQRTMASQKTTRPIHPGIAESNIRYYLQLGNEAEQLGRVTAARVYYQMAIETMTPDMKARYDRILELRSKDDAKKPAASSNRKRF